MIRYSLSCHQGHAFESWFKSSADYDKQAARGLIGCAVCGSTKVEKALMAPGIAKGAGRELPAEAPPPALPAVPPPQAPTPVAMLSDKERELRAKLRELREHVVKHAEYVGQKFPEEARKMHYGDIEHHSIYGEATPADAAELIEEGIDLHPLPILPDERN